jgi:hypothetical protein
MFEDGAQPGRWRQGRGAPVERLFRFGRLGGAPQHASAFPLDGSRMTLVCIKP